MANIIGAGSYDPRSTQEKYLDALKKYAPAMKQADGTSLTAQALQNATHLKNTNTPGIEAVKSAYGITAPTTPTTPTVTTPVVTPTTTVVTPQEKAPIQSAQSSGTNGQDYINQLKEAQLRQKYADLQNAYNKNISSLNAEKATIEPMYYDKRNQASTTSQLQAKNFAEYLAARGQTNSGVAGQSELNRSMTLQGNIGSLNRQEAQNVSDIERRRSDLATALEQDRISQASGIEANALNNLVSQFNTDRNYNYQLNRDAINDSRYSNETSYNRGLDSFNQGLQVAGLTGNYNGNRTMAGLQSDASLANTQANTAYQNLVNAGYNQRQAAEISQILASTAGVKLDNAAQAIANKYAPQIAQGQIDGVKLQNAYQKLVNAGYPEKQAAEIAAQNANIAQGWSQIGISQQNANTSAASQAWSQSDKNPDNIYKQAQIEKIQSGVSGSAASMTTKQIGDAKVKIAQQLYNQNMVVPTQAEIDSAFTSLYGTATKPTTTNSNAQELYSAADGIPASNRQKWYNDNKTEIDKHAGADLKAFKAKYGLK